MSLKNNHINNSAVLHSAQLTKQPLKPSFNPITLLLWLLFMASTVMLLFYYPNIPNWEVGNLIRINGFSLLIWAVVTFFSGIVSSYANRYLDGFKYKGRFSYLSLGFTFSVMLFVIANNVVLLLAFWFFMGLFMARLIGIQKEWREAREASGFAQKFFIASAVLLGVGLFLLAFQADAFTLSGLTAAIDDLSPSVLLISAICIIAAAMIQSAIFPFHKWLLTAMTAPTPASALMHAGFINGSGILLAFFATLIFLTNTLSTLLIIGGLTAIIAQFTKLLQVNVKQKLACSTIAQMGFMLMQCGLGFFNAAVVHLILHGFYKAYLFLSVGEEIKALSPEHPEALNIKPLQALVVLVYGILGAVLFALLTGKGMQMDSGIFLTLIVAISVGQVTYNFVKQKSFSPFQQLVVPLLLFVAGIVSYALAYNFVTQVMADMPMVDVPTAITPVQIAFGIVFLIGFFIMKLGVYRNIPWVYVKLLNISQPYKNTVLISKNKDI